MTFFGFGPQIYDSTKFLPHQPPFTTSVCFKTIDKEQFQNHLIIKGLFLKKIQGLKQKKLTNL